MFLLFVTIHQLYKGVSVPCFTNSWTKQASVCSCARVHSQILWKLKDFSFGWWLLLPCVVEVSIEEIKIYFYMLWYVILKNTEIFCADISNRRKPAQLLRLWFHLKPSKPIFTTEIVLPHIIIMTSSFCKVSSSLYDFPAYTRIKAFRARFYLDIKERFIFPLVNRDANSREPNTLIYLWSL